MALIDDCILWHKLNDVGDSEIGVNPTPVGTPTFVNGKFDDALESPDNTSSVPFKTNFLNFANGDTSPNANMIGWWWYPYFASTAVVAHSILESVKGVWPGTAKFLYVYWNSANRIIITTYGLGVNRTFYGFAPTFIAYTWYHILLINNANAGAGGKHRLYFNGTEISGTVLGNDNSWSHTNRDIKPGVVETANWSCASDFDNIKAYNNISQSSIDAARANRNNEGFPAVTYRLLTPSRKKRLYKQKIIIAGIDLYQGERILEFPKIEYRKTFDKDKIFINILKIRCRNDDNFFSKDNPKSPFFGIDYYKQPTQIIDRDENLIWAGELFDIGRNHRNFESTIITGNEIYSDRYSKIEYSSADWETGAEAVDNIFSTYGIENLNRNSIETSKAYLIENDCKIKVTVVLDDKRSLISVIEDIARNSSADFFDFKGELYFQIYRPRTDLIITKSISERDFMKNPVVDAPDKFLVNDYAIHYDGDGGTPATDSNTDNIGYLSRVRNGIHSLQGVTGDSKITFEKKIAAQFIGEQYIRRTHKNLLTRPEPLQQINFSLPIDIRKWFDLFTFYKINFARESWSDKILETFKLGYDNTNGIIEMNNFEMAS